MSREGLAPEEKMLKHIRMGVLLTPIVIILGFIGYTEISWQAKPQPINFSHKLHAGVREIDCKYCHRGVVKGNNAGVPAVMDCWQCHQTLTNAKAPGSNGVSPIERPEVQKLLNDYVAQHRDIQWFKYYDLPEHVKFAHRAHINAGLDCKECHGDVAKMDVIQMQQKTTMGWCISCHRQKNAPVDCTTCHY